MRPLRCNSRPAPKSLQVKRWTRLCKIEFTIDADSSHTYKISPRIKQFLEEHISFYTEGPARVVSAKVEITPKDVSWTENRSTITSTGAAMAARLQWDTPADSANGAHGNIYINFPEVPGLEGKAPDFHSGGYQKDDKGRYAVREVTTYRDASHALLCTVRLRPGGRRAPRRAAAHHFLGIRLEG